MKRTYPTNKELQNTIVQLRRSKAAIWKRVAEDLSSPTRQRRTVNLIDINKHIKEGETAIVPGKVLGVGNITKKVTIAAFSYSDAARDKITQAGGKAISLPEAINKNNKNMRLLG